MGSPFVTRMRERLQRRPAPLSSAGTPVTLTDAAFQIVQDLAHQVARQEILLTAAQLRVCALMNSNRLKPGQIGLFNTYITSLNAAPRDIYYLAELNYAAAEYSAVPRLMQICVQTLSNAIADLNDPSLVHREIAVYERVLPVVRQLGDTNALAALLNNLGAAYADSLSGERVENLQQAIKYYREALSHYTEEAYPREYAIVQTNLGYIYYELSCGNEAMNMRRAINCYRAALDVALTWTPNHEAIQLQNSEPVFESGTEQNPGRIRAASNVTELITGKPVTQNTNGTAIKNVTHGSGSAMIARNRLLADAKRSRSS